MASLLRRCLWPVVVLVATSMGSTLAKAVVVVTGSTASIEVIANNATLRDALNAIAAKCNIALHGTENLNEPISGTYKGDLRYVVGQMMGSRNHIMRPDGATLGLFVLDAKPSEITASEQPAPSADPVRANIEAGAKPPLSPEAQELAVKMFGEKGRNLKVDEGLLRSFYKGRGGRRYVGQPIP